MKWVSEAGWKRGIGSSAFVQFYHWVVEMLLTADDSQNYVIVIENLIAQLHKDYYTQQENFIHICRLHKRYSCNTARQHSLLICSSAWSCNLARQQHFVRDQSVCVLLSSRLPSETSTSVLFNIRCRVPMEAAAQLLTYFILRVLFLSWISQVFPCKGPPTALLPVLTMMIERTNSERSSWFFSPTDKEEVKESSLKRRQQQGCFFFSFLSQIIFCIGRSTLH